MQPIISCPDCGRQIDSRRTACPFCGYPIARMWRRLRRAAILAILALGVATWAILFR